MPISKKENKKTNKKKRTLKRRIKKQKGGNNVTSKKIPNKQNIVTNNVQAGFTTKEVPTVSSENKSIDTSLNTETNSANVNVNINNNKTHQLSDNTDSDENSDDDEVEKSMQIIEQFLSADCNNVVFKDLMFIVKDMNKILLEILPLFDEELVDIIIIFLANFNKKFAEDEDFRNQLNIAIENVIETIINSGMDALGSGCGVIVKILTTMAQAIPGAGAVISSLMIANNIADTGKQLSNSGKNISIATNDFSTKMSELMGKISDSMPKIDNQTINFQEVFERKRQESKIQKPETNNEPK